MLSLSDKAEVAVVATSTKGAALDTDVVAVAAVTAIKAAAGRT